MYTMYIVKFIENVHMYVWIRLVVEFRRIDLRCFFQKRSDPTELFKLVCVFDVVHFLPWWCLALEKEEDDPCFISNSRDRSS